MMDSAEIRRIPNIERRLATRRPLPEPGPPVENIAVYLILNLSIHLHYVCMYVCMYVCSMSVCM